MLAVDIDRDESDGPRGAHRPDGAGRADAHRVARIPERTALGPEVVLWAELEADAEALVDAVRKGAVGRIRFDDLDPRVRDAINAAPIDRRRQKS